MAVAGRRPTETPPGGTPGGPTQLDPDDDGMGLDDDWMPTIKEAAAGVFGDVSDEQVSKLVRTLWGESQPEAKRRKAEQSQGDAQGIGARSEGATQPPHGS